MCVCVCVCINYVAFWDHFHTYMYIHGRKYCLLISPMCRIIDLFTVYFIASFLLRYHFYYMASVSLKINQ